MLVDAKQSSYMRGVRMRELKRLATWNGNESDEEDDEKKVRGRNLLKSNGCEVPADIILRLRLNALLAVQRGTLAWP